MQIPTLSLVDTIDSTSGVVVIPVCKGDTPALLAAEDFGLDADRLAALGVTGKAGSTQRILLATGDTERPALLVGLGDERTLEALRRGAGAASRALKQEDEIVFLLEDASADELEALALGAALGSHTFDRYRTQDDDAPATERTIAVVGAGEEAQAAVERATVLAESVALARDLGNTPANDLVPEDVAQLASDVFAELPVEVEVWDEDRLLEEGCGGLIGVGQGSVNPPRLVKLSYSPADAARHVALVGKGITFDTGGISLKPAASMLGMKYDMSGAGTVVATVLAAARLGLPVRITGYCCLAENMPSSTALKPDDVIIMRGGTSVEVTNTDAEGRLVLADGLALASESTPDLIIDIATLTGAAVVALGDRTTGVMGNTEAEMAAIVAAGEHTGEPMWPMPIPEELDERLESNVADLVNSKPGDRSGGMLFAAAFLERFVGDDADGEPLPWIHLDIAGPADNGSGAYGYIAKGATGVPVRTLVEYLAAAE